MNANSVEVVETGAGVFLSQYALVKSEIGDFVYGLQHEEGSWKNLDDYLNFAKEDFENSFNPNDPNDELFIKFSNWK